MSELGRPFLSDTLPCLFGTALYIIFWYKYDAWYSKICFQLIKNALSIECTYCLMSKCVARLPYLSARDYSEQVKLSILVSPRG